MGTGRRHARAGRKDGSASIHPVKLSESAFSRQGERRKRNFLTIDVKMPVPQQKQRFLIRQVHDLCRLLSGSAPVNYESRGGAIQASVRVYLSHAKKDGRLFLLKTAHHERFRYDYKALAVDVALATSAAPTYFKASPFPEHEGTNYVDGGVWANCPALAGVVEAHSFLNVPLEEIDVLSIGTTTTPFNIQKNANAGIAQWNAGLIDLMFNAQVEAARAQARLLLKGRLHRIDIVASPGQFSLDNATPEKIEQLIQLGRGEAVKKVNLDVVQSRFLNDTPAAKFEPLYHC